MITARRAIQVAVDDPVTSTQANSFSLGVNDRMRALGDIPWRIGFYIANAARQVRNPDEWLWPSMMEYWEHYQHAEITRGEGWPPADPGDAQGANLASTMMAFVHGNPSTYPEADRLFIDDGFGGNLLRAVSVGATPAALWAAGQRQRGAYDPDTGDQNVPAFQAAQDYAKIDQLSTEVWLPAVVGGVQKLEVSGTGSLVHGLSYGGYLPQPEYLEDCGDADFTPSFEYVFTPLRAGLATNGTNDCTGAAAMVFTGSCPSWTPNYDPSHVRGILRTTHAYFVVQWNGTITELRTKDYIEGPYCYGGRLDKTHGDMVARLAQHSFVKDFRGSDTERALPGYSIEDYGFDFDRFDRSQYFLSPNLGHTSGEYIVADYPSFSWSGAASHAAGTLGVYSGGGTSHSYRSGFVLGGALLVAAKLAAPVTVELLNNGVALREVVLEPDENGDASAVTWFETAVGPAPLTVRVKTALTFVDDTGTLTVECTEQMEYRPEAHDRYLWLRMAATTGSVMGGVDGSGVDCSRPKDLSDAYFASGCIVSRTPADPLTDAQIVNDNPGFDAFRRFTRDKFRIMRRQQVVGYAVESGKSVLWFKRFSYLDDDFDMFEGIAPAHQAIAPGMLAEGVGYVVGTGSIVYGGVTYTAGQSFTATAEITWTGEGTVYERDGIRHTAPKRGLTNEWLMTAEFQRYHWAPDNLWKPDAVADYFAYCSRCHAMSGVIGSGSTNADLRRHFNYGQPMLFAPEAPPGYNYAGTANMFSSWPEADRIRFYKSCRIYEPWPEVESAVVVEEGGEQIVKLTFTSRFHHCETDEGGFSGDLARDMSTWSTTQMNGETFRSLENGIRQYLYHIYAGGGGGTYNPAPKIGDLAAEVPNPDGNPYGAIYPHFFFVKLMPLVRADGNDEMSSEDTPIVMDLAQQGETYLRAMCEAFIDGVSSLDYGCRNYITEAFDYRWENLLYDVAAGRWLGSLPDTVRADEMSGFSALPDTVLYAQVFSQLGAALNRLDKLRILLPVELQYRPWGYEGYQDVTPDWIYASRAIWSGTPPDATTPDGLGEAPWTVWWDGIGAQVTSTLNVSGIDDWYMYTSKTTLEYKIELTDGNAVHAVPPALLDMFTASPGFVARKWVARNYYTATAVGTEAEAQDCPIGSGSGRFWNGSVGYAFNDLPVPPDDDVESCEIFYGGIIDPGIPPGDPASSTHWRAYEEVECGSATYHSIALAPASKLGLFVVIPLVDHTET